ncbi:hypothetical protein [Mycobacterium sp. SA01]|uniref:hypothetical protein n=1 Tax=Mycobacterium sp. SA01 TaxID=3238820 RepID=UPI00351B8626
MTTNDPGHESLLSALSQARIPVGNHDFIRRLTSAIGIDGYRVKGVESSKPYVLAVRRDALADLHIYYGYTTGFISEEEIIQVLGGGVVREPSSRTGTWYVAHPINEIRPRGDSSRDSRRKTTQFCYCGIELPLTGVCEYCG